jgi:hypothetical protein
MKMTVVLAVAAMSLALSGCNTAPIYGEKKPQQKLDCRSINACEVQVSVACCGVSVNSYAVIISQKNGKDTIAWRLPKDSSFAFASNEQGVVFDDDGKRVFACKTEADGHRLSCRSSDPNFGVYKYTLNVVGAFGITWSLDPWVINN